jgi:hypothetical protein
VEPHVLPEHPQPEIGVPGDVERTQAPIWSCARREWLEVPPCGIGPMREAGPGGKSLNRIANSVGRGLVHRSSSHERWVNQARPVVAAQNHHLAVTEEERPRAPSKRLVELFTGHRHESPALCWDQRLVSAISEGSSGSPVNTVMRSSRSIAARAILRMLGSSPERGIDPPRRRNPTSSTWPYRSAATL